MGVSCMRINFLVNEVAGGWEPTDKRLGGTEESVVRWAKEFGRRGHTVYVYRNGRMSECDMGQNGITGPNVWFMERNGYKGGGDICINIKSSEIAPKEPTLYLTNETNASDLDLSKYLGVIWPSQWCVDNIPVNNPNVFIVPHGYDHTKIYPKDKVQKRCLYASSPDRGLETLGMIWPSVVAQHPDAELYVTYGGKLDAPNVISGEFTEEEMNELYNTSDLWLHPCNGGELYGITGIKAQAAGAIPVYFPTMALSETVKAGVPCVDERDMYFNILELMDNVHARFKLRQKLASIHQPNWEDSTNALESVIIQSCQ